MKKILLLGVMFATFQSKSQLLVNLQLPPNGILQKTQLWNMAITNTGTVALSLHIEMMMLDAKSSMQVMSAATHVITVSPGTTQLHNTLLQPVQYNVLTSAYNIDNSSNGLLPVGDFETCYSFIRHTSSDAVEKIAEECRELIVEPLSPPQLVYPYDQSVIETRNPQLTWLSPMPVNLFNNLRYDLDLVEVYPQQSASDAVQQNISLFRQRNITGTTLLYPVSAPPLEFKKQYAWRILARSNEMPVGQSETWMFSLKEFNRIDSIEPGDLPFAKLKKEVNAGYAIFSTTLKFDYLNESGDSLWNLSVYDLSLPEKSFVNLPMDSIALKPGQNLVSYDVSKIPGFTDKHLYMLEVINSRKESWVLRFEYRKAE
jgi:hypothetical protein